MSLRGDLNFRFSQKIETVKDYGTSEVCLSTFLLYDVNSSLCGGFKEDDPHRELNY